MKLKPTVKSVGFFDKKLKKSQKMVKNFHIGIDNPKFYDIM